MKSRVFKYSVLFIIIVAVLSRVPMMLGPNFFLDGDECLEGLMAKMMIQRQEFSLFPWGQDYGFSLIETTVIIPFCLLLGYCTLAVKLGILSVWVVGVILLYKTLCIVTEEKVTAFYLIILFILFPAWNAPSMKAYGGYVTAFMLSNLLLYLLFNGGFNRTWLYYAGIGFLLVLIAESQRLWLIGVLPIVVYQLWNESKWKEAGIVAFAGAVVSILFHYYKQHLPIAHALPVVPPNTDNIIWYVTRFPDYLYSSMHGDYYFNQYQAPSLFNGLYALAGAILFFALLLMGLYELIFVRKKNTLFIVSIIFIPLCFAYTFFTHAMEGRYLLPVSGFMLITLGILLNRYVPSRAVKVGTGTLIIIGIASCISFYNFCEISKEYKKSVLSTIGYLQANNIQYAYCTDAMLPYQIVFYSDTKIMCRMPFQPARYQPYSDAVDSAFDWGVKVAMLQYQNQTQNMSFRFDKKTPDIAICINPLITEMWKGIEFHHILAK